MTTLERISEAFAALGRAIQHAYSFAFQLSDVIGWDASPFDVEYIYARVRRRAVRHGELGLVFESFPKGEPIAIHLRGLRVPSLAHIILGAANG